MRVVLAITLSATFAFAQGTDTATRPGETDVVHEAILNAEAAVDVREEKKQAPGIEYIESTNKNRDLEVGLTNGFRFSLRMRDYGAEALANYEKLSAVKREKFLEARKWLTSSFAGLLTSTFFVPGAYFVFRDVIYYAGDRSEPLREIYQTYFQGPTKENMVSVFREETWAYQRRDWSIPQISYRDQIFRAYTRIMHTFDEQLVRMAGILNIYDKPFVEDGMIVSGVLGGSVRGGKAGAGVTPPFWISLGINWQRKSIIARYMIDRERSIIGLNVATPGVRVGHYRATGRQETLNGRFVQGETFAPWGPFSFSSTPEMTIGYLGLGTPSTAALVGMVAAGFSPLPIILASLAPSPEWGMSAVGSVSRAEIYELEIGPNAGRFWVRANKMPGYYVARGIFIEMLRWVTDRSRRALQSARSTAALLLHPNEIVEKYRSAQQRRNEAYRPRSCNLIFNGPIPNFRIE